MPPPYTVLSSNEKVSAAAVPLMVRTVPLRLKVAGTWRSSSVSSCGRYSEECGATCGRRRLPRQAARQRVGSHARDIQGLLVGEGVNQGRWGAKETVARGRFGR